MKSRDLEAVLDFLYHGEANIYQEDLDSFLAIAEELQLKGLTGSQNLKNEQLTTETKKNEQFNKANPLKDNTNKHVVYQTKLEQIKVNPEYHPENYATALMESEKYTLTTDLEDLDEQIKSMMEKIDGQWTCVPCGKITKDKTHLSNHIEGKHIDGVSHPCQFCGGSFR